MKIRYGIDSEAAVEALPQAPKEAIVLQDGTQAEVKAPAAAPVEEQLTLAEQLKRLPAWCKAAACVALGYALARG